jgi:hypothetical protein
MVCLPPTSLQATKGGFVNSVGRPKHERVMAGSIEGDMFIGRKAQELRGLLKVSSVHRGVPYSLVTLAV